jgi:hypothetical protein
MAQFVHRGLLFLIRLERHSGQSLSLESFNHTKGSSLPAEYHTCSRDSHCCKTSTSNCTKSICAGEYILQQPFFIKATSNFQILPELHNYLHMSSCMKHVGKLKLPSLQCANCSFRLVFPPPHHLHYEHLFTFYFLLFFAVMEKTMLRKSFITFSVE